MSARDIYHNSVKNALVKDGWKITHDPLILKWGLKDLYVDLGAEQLVAAEKAGQKIAVEIKSFVSPSEVEDLKNALGQFVFTMIFCPVRNLIACYILRFVKPSSMIYFKSLSAASC
jgi:hypothetical protein